MSCNNSFFKQKLISLKAKGLLRELFVVDSPQDAWINIGGKRVLNLCSNNYLGLANDKRLKKAGINAIKKFGVGSGASRLVCANMKLHKELEDSISKFKQSEAALLFNSGYNANLGIIQALCDKDDIIFSDKLNHASIIDGIILSRAEFRRYPHKDILVLEELLRKERARRRRALIVTDTIFSMDGDIAPIPELLRLAKKYDCFLMLDEAHATGVLGKQGRGALEYFDIKPDGCIVQMGTLSKAVGCFGAYVCGSLDLIDFLINRARSFIYTTALPVTIAATCIESLRIIQEEPDLREKLWENVRFFKGGLKNLGFNIGQTQTQIIPIIIGDTRFTMEFSKRLFAEGIFVQGIRPPTVPQGGARLRVTLMATHKKADLELALDEFKKIGRKLSIVGG